NGTEIPAGYRMRGDLRDGLAAAQVNENNNCSEGQKDVKPSKPQAFRFHSSLILFYVSENERRYAYISKPSGPAPNILRCRIEAEGRSWNGTGGAYRVASRVKI